MASHHRKTKGGGMTEIRPGSTRRVRTRLFFIVPNDNAGRCIDRKLADPVQLSAFSISAFQLFGSPDFRPETLNSPPSPLQRTIARLFVLGGTSAHSTVGCQAACSGHSSPSTHQSTNTASAEAPKPKETKEESYERSTARPHRQQHIRAHQTRQRIRRRVLVQPGFRPGSGLHRLPQFCYGHNIQLGN